MEDNDYSQDEELLQALGLIPSITNLQQVFLFAALGLSSLIFGSKLCPDDFTKCVKKPTGLWLSLMVSVLLAPLVAFVLVRIMQLPFAVAIEVLVISCCPAGTLSPVFAYYTQADVGLCLSVIVLSTLMSVGMIPLGVFLCSSAYTELDLTDIPNGLIVITLGTTMGGIAMGMTFRKYNEKWANRVSQVLSSTPILVTVAMIVIVGIRLPHSIHARMADVFVVLLYFTIILSGTYAIGLLTGQTHETCRAMAFCSASKSVLLALTIVHSSFTGEVLIAALPIPTLFLIQYILIGVMFSIIYKVYRVYVPEFSMDY